MSNTKPYFKLFLWMLLFFSATLWSYSVSDKVTETTKAVPSLLWLQSRGAVNKPFKTTIFIPLQKQQQKYKPLSGHLLVNAITGSEYFKIYKDRYKISLNEDMEIAQLPPLAFDFVQHGEDIIPAVSNIQRSSHPYWEWQVSPGKIWQEKNESAYRRIVLPFSLQEKNANCTHNGLMLLILDPKRVEQLGYFQITSETCSYLQFDLAAKLTVSWQNKKIANADKIINKFIDEQKYQIAVYSKADLKKDYPRLKIEKLLPRFLSGSTTSGIVVGGKNYQLNCQTRYGDYPYCEQLALPSYSTAKSIFAGLVTMRLDHLFPGVSKVLLQKIIPTCDEKKWQNVILDDLLNMRTGNYLSKKPHKDEASSRMLKFFLSMTNKEKISLACTMFPSKSPPGKTMVYHTSDTYLAGVMLNKIYQKLTKNNDVYNSLLVEGLWKKLHLSALLNTSKRTYDLQKQTFTGWGLTYKVDDIIKISQFLQRQLTAQGNEILLDQTMLASALQFGDKRINRDGAEAGLAYNYGFWALEVGRELRCKKATWIPFMSGFGGITVALISKDLLYYNYADNDQYLWLKVIKELNKQFSICERY